MLDTSIIVDIFIGEQEIIEKTSRLRELYIPSIVLGELYVGVNRAANKTKHLKKLNEFLESCKIVDVNRETAEYYGSIMADLYKKGKPIPTNDVWIAAVAQQHNCIVVTRDKHFKEIKDIKLKHW